ncbi:MAG: HAMP domain-containing histidine kinase [Chloroflexi bacterium]|nr:HAMP domain-containing histidine kinase [Chloroflexota bacterium]
MPASLRWRLPLSYALIALLTAAALGIVLLLTLQTIYQRQELAYLSGNAAKIAEEVHAFVKEEERPFLQTQIDGFSFLVQARVEVLDVDKQLVAESSDAGLSTPAISVGSLPGFELFSEEEVVTSIETEQEFENGVVRNERVISRTTIFPARDTLYGFSLDGEQTELLERSNLAVEAPVLNNDAEIVGFVRLSQGPAYGRSILNSVMVAWIVAGGVAVLIAVIAGWLASRRLTQPLLVLTDSTTRMAQGDLSVRTTMQRTDELGLLATAFNQMAQRIENTVTTLRQFVADAAHELNTPLTALNTNLELVAQHTTDDQQTTRVSRAQAQMSRLQTLTDSLLDLSKIEAGENGLSHESVSLNQLVNQLAEQVASQAEQSGLEFTVELPAYDVAVLGNEAQLQRALYNLLENGLKFTPEGGEIKLSLARLGDDAQLQVMDTGIGIPEADRVGLYGRFHRARNVAHIPGNGLGLAIVKAIVDAHSGQIISQPNHPTGTQFTITIPVM